MSPNYSRRVVQPVYGVVRHRRVQRHPQRYACPTAVAAYGDHNRSLPTLHLSETPENLTLTIELPGLKATEIAQWDVQVSRDRIWLRGNLPKLSLEPQPQARLAIDFASGLVGLVGPAELQPTQRVVDRSFERQIKLPCAVQQTQVQAAVQDGLLTLTLPKVENDRSVTVKIGVAPASDLLQPGEPPREPAPITASESAPEVPVAAKEIAAATGSSNPTAISPVVEEAIPDPWTN